jgi:hypothetical protein
MIDEPNTITAPTEIARARSTDPETSHLAALEATGFPQQAFACLDRIAPGRAPFTPKKVIHTIHMDSGCPSEICKVEGKKP